MAYTFHEESAPYLEQAFVYSLGLLASEEAGGVLEIDRTGKMLGTGHFMDIPKITEPSAPVRRDISTTSQTRSFTEMANSEERGIICHDDNADVFPIGNKTFAGLDFQRFWLSRLGLLFARRSKQQLYRVAKAAVEVVDTPTADCHISDQYSSTVNQTMSFARLQNARALMGDAAGTLVTVVMHSTCWNNLVQDGIANYKVENVSGRLINTGGITDSSQLRAMRQTAGSMRIVDCHGLGMRIIVDDDISSIDMTGTTYVYKEKYETLLLGAGSMLLSYQRGLTPFMIEDADDARGVVVKLRGEIDYCAHLYGIKWNVGTTNPSDVALGTKSNWDEAYADHREVGCVKLITNG